MRRRSGPPALTGVYQASGTTAAARTATGESVGRGLVTPGALGKFSPAGYFGASESAGVAWGLLAVFLVTLVLSFAYYRAAWAAPTRTYSGDIGDPEQIMWFLGWIPYAILHGHNPLVTNYGLYPSGANVMWNTSVILPSILVSPVTLLFGPIAAFNVLVVSAPVFTACTAYLAFVRYVRSRVAAIVGAVAFGFCPFLVYQQLGHQQLSLLALLPLTFLLSDELLVRQRWRFWVTGALLGFVAACQLLTGEEMLTIEAIMAVVGLVTLALVHFRQVREKLPYVLKGAATALGVFVVLAGYPLYVQFRGPLRVHSVHPASLYVTDLAGVVQPVGQLVSFRLVPDAWTLHVEPTAYIGIPLLIIVLATIVLGIRRRRPIVALSLVMLVVFGLFTLGSRLHVDGHIGFTLPWGWLGFDKRTLVRNVLPGRLTVVIDFFATLLLAVFVDMLIASRKHLAGAATGAALVALALVSWIPAAAGTTTPTLPSFFTSSLKDRIPEGSVALVSPYVYGSFTETALVWQSASGMRYRMVDGWLIVPGKHDGPPTIASTTIKALQAGSVALTPTLRSEMLSYLHANKVDEVIVGPGPGEARQITFFTSLLGRGPYSTAGGVFVWHVG